MPRRVNPSMVFGSRLRGIAGGIAAFTRLLLPPRLIMIVLAITYARFGNVDILRGGCRSKRCCWLRPREHQRGLRAATQSSSMSSESLIWALISTFCRPTDRTVAALLLIATVAVIASVSRINPLWLLLAGGCWVLLALCDENR